MLGNAKLEIAGSVANTNYVNSITLNNLGGGDLYLLNATSDQIDITLSEWASTTQSPLTPLRCSHQNLYQLGSHWNNIEGIVSLSEEQPNTWVHLQVRAKVSRLLWWTRECGIRSMSRETRAPVLLYAKHSVLQQNPFANFTVRFAVQLTAGRQCHCHWLIQAGVSLQYRDSCIWRSVSDWGAGGSFSWDLRLWTGFYWRARWVSGVSLIECTARTAFDSHLGEHVGNQIALTVASLLPESVSFTSSWVCQNFENWSHPCVQSTKPPSQVCMS